MMRAYVLGGVAAACLAMTGCGQAADTPAVTAAAPEVAAAPASAAAVPAGLPDYLAPMPGAKIIQATSHDNMQTLEYSVDKPLADVVAHHREAMKAAGKTPAADMGTGDGHSITWGEGAAGVSITFTAESAGATRVSIMNSN